MTDCLEISACEADEWHMLHMQHLTDGEMLKLLDWLTGMQGGRFYWTLSKNFWFEREEDRMMCVLTWK